jgi:hypothetical protein
MQNPVYIQTFNDSQITIRFQPFNIIIASVVQSAYYTRPNYRTSIAKATSVSY